MAEQSPSEPEPLLTEELVAYLDDELPPEAARSMATRISLDPKLRAEVTALQRTWDMLDMLPKPKPSEAFLARTVTSAIPVPADGFATSVQPARLPASPTMVALPLAKVQRRFGIAVAVTIALAGPLGYLGHWSLADRQTTLEQPKVEDHEFLKNARLLRHADDLHFVKALDSPDLFGDEEGGQ